EMKKSRSLRQYRGDSGPVSLLACAVALVQRKGLGQPRKGAEQVAVVEEARAVGNLELDQSMPALLGLGFGQLPLRALAFLGSERFAGVRCGLVAGAGDPDGGNHRDGSHANQED